MLGVSLDIQNDPRASQIILSHALIARRKLFGKADHEVAATYGNNLANLLRHSVSRKQVSGGGGGSSAASGTPSSSTAANDIARERALEKQAFVETLYRRAIAIREAVHGPNSLSSPQHYLI